jgi:hypothetical protein
MVPSPQTEEERAVERSWSHRQPEGVFGKKKFESFEFVAPLTVKEANRIHPLPPIPLPPQQQLPLVKSSPEDHKDKIGGGGRRVGMSFQEDTRRIRKGPAKMRNIQQPTGDQAEGSNEHRKLIKPRNRKEWNTRDLEMAEGEFEEEIM